MSVGRSAAWACLIACLTFVGSTDARARLAEPDVSDDARPAPETRKVLTDDEVDRDAALRDRGRDRDQDRDRVRPRARVIVDSDDEVDDRDDDDARADRRRSRDERDWFRDPGYYGYGNFPTIEVHDAVV